MGIGDPDHHHPLSFVFLQKNDRFDCFRCDLPIKYDRFDCFRPDCYGCDCCSHYVHILCFNLSENMRHPLHPQHSLTLFPSPSPHITSDCDQCHEPFHGGYTYSCQECLKFNLHLKCFLTLNLETKHHHPLRLCEINNSYSDWCAVCGLWIHEYDTYRFSCEDCNFFMHFDCAFLPQTVKHHHVHELTFGYNYPEESDLAYCDVCEDRDGKELDRTLSYYYCKACDYIAHVRCVTSKPAKVTTQIDHIIHEHPMTYMRNPIYGMLIECAACPRHDQYGGGDDFSASFYFCSICNYLLHESCVQFPRFVKHPCHQESHTLSLQPHASEDNGDDSQLVCCDFCDKELERLGWILRCSDCDCAIHLSCACDFEHPLYKDTILTFSSDQETKFRCNACGELGDGFRMSCRRSLFSRICYDLHKECFALRGQIEHACHSHPLYLVNSLTEVETYLSTTLFQCDICHTEADPDLWVYCCIQCRYIAHLTCVVNDLLPAGRSGDLSNFFPTPMCEEEKFLVVTKQVHCSKLLKHNPAFVPRGFFNDREPPLGNHNGQPITSYIVHCPKCDIPISAQAYSSVDDWIHRNLKASIYNIQIETPADHKSFDLLDEKVAEELTCPICNLLIFPPTYSCADCQIFFHKSCAELPRKYTVDGGHTLFLQLLPMKSGSLTNCSRCECPFKGYAYVCEICEIGFDVTCALGSPLLKLENQNHSFASSSIQATSIIQSQYWLTDPPLNRCGACGNLINQKSMHFACEAPNCGINLHFKCAMLPSMVKVERRIHHHPLVLEPSLDLSVDDYICDVCEKELNPCIWVYRCSDSCGDRATFHVSCIITSKKKKCHFIYDQECSYPHLENPGQYLKENLAVPYIAGELVSTPPERQHEFLYSNLFRFVRELEHEYAHLVTAELMEMDQAEVLHLMESPDALRAKVAETMKRLTSILPVATDEDGGEEKDENEVDTDDEIKGK